MAVNSGHSHHSGGWKSRVNAKADSVSGDVLLPGSQTAVFSVLPGRKGEGALRVLFRRMLILFMRAPPL